jgi:hypothetical protein
MAQPSHELSVRISQLAESDAYVNKRYKKLFSSGGSHSLTASLRMVTSAATRAVASCFKAGRRKRPVRAQHSATAALPSAGHSEPVTEPTLTALVINTDSQVRSPFNPPYCSLIHCHCDTFAAWSGQLLITLPCQLYTVIPSHPHTHCCVNDHSTQYNECNRHTPDGTMLIL